MTFLVVSGLHLTRWVPEYLADDQALTPSVVVPDVTTVLTYPAPRTMAV